MVRGGGIIVDTVDSMCPMDDSRIPLPVTTTAYPLATPAAPSRHCYENRSISQATELPQTEVRGLRTRQTGGFSPRDMHARGEAYPLPQDDARFHRPYVAWQCHGVSRAETTPYPDTGREPRGSHRTCHTQRSSHIEVL